MAPAVGDEMTVRMVVKDIVPGEHPAICLAPARDRSFSWWVPLSVIQGNILAAPLRDKRPPANPAMPGNLYGDDELVSLLLKRLAAHAATPAAILPVDYGRIEELCWLIRWVMSDGALPAT